jgi:PAS domain S-box-containing protein
MMAIPPTPVSEFEIDQLRNQVLAQQDQIEQLETIIKQFYQWPREKNFLIPSQDYRVENELHVTEDIWRYMIEKSPDMINIVDPDGRILYNNGSLDVNFSATIGQKFSAQIHPQEREKVEKAIQRVFSTGELITFEVSDPQKQLWCMNRMAPIRYQGKIIAIMVMIRDITELKTALDSVQSLNLDLENIVAERTQELRASYDQLENLAANQEKLVRTLYQITSVASEALDMDVLLKKLLTLTLAAIDCSFGLIHLWDADQHQLVITVKEERAGELFDSFDLHGNPPPWELVYSSRKALNLPIRDFCQMDERRMTEAHAAKYYGVPIQVKGTILGVLSLLGAEERHLDDTTVQFVESISDQIGLAIESARLRKQMEDAMIAEERQRLARDLHDSISQSLYGLVLSSEAGGKLLANKDYEKLDVVLEKIKQTSVQSLKEFRLMLHQLHPHPLDANGLVEAIDLRLNTVERRSGIEAQLQAEGMEYMPAAVRQEIYFVVMEALNNTLKHSFASHVAISICCDPKNVEMNITDDGCGFNQKRRSGGGIGSMQNRVARLGGQFQITSSPDHGTQIRVVVPIHS